MAELPLEDKLRNLADLVEEHKRNLPGWDLSRALRHCAEQATSLRSALAKCREETVEECAKAICSLCRDGVPLETEITHSDFRGFHKLGIASDGLNDYEDCAAISVHALASTGDGR